MSPADPLPRRAALSIVAGACLTLAAWAGEDPQAEGLQLVEPAPAVALRPPRVGGLEAYACAGCHAEVTAEWAATTHGLAWVDEVYQEALAAKKRPELCYGCHAPEPLLAGLLARPEPRTAARELGVSCESCHADHDGTMLGPRGTSVSAHPSKRSDAMLAPGSNALCSACHATNIGPVIGIAKDFAAAKLEERGLSCVGCHMAPLERAWASEAPRRSGRSHALQTPRDPSFLRQAFGLELSQSAEGARLVVRNRAGHRVPGLIGRRIDLTAQLLDDAGAVLEERALSLDERAYLPVDGTRELSFTHPGARVRVRGLHHDPRASTPVEFLDETLPHE